MDNAATLTPLSPGWVAVLHLIMGLRPALPPHVMADLVNSLEATARSPRAAAALKLSSLVRGPQHQQLHSHILPRRPAVSCSHKNRKTVYDSLTRVFGASGPRNCVQVSAACLFVRVFLSLLVGTSKSGGLGERGREGERERVCGSERESLAILPCSACNRYVKEAKEQLPQLAQVCFSYQHCLLHPVCGFLRRPGRPKVAELLPQTGVKKAVIAAIARARQG